MIRVAVCGVDEVTGREIARRLRAGSVMACLGTSFSDAVADDCDAVAFVGKESPDAIEVERIVAAGKHVLLATETIMSVEAVDDMIDRAREAGVQISVKNPDHARPSRQLIHQQVDDNKLGFPGLIRIHRWEPSAADRGLDSTNLPVPLVRDLELSLWLMDCFPDLVYAVERKSNEQDTSSPGSIQVHLGFSEAAMALIDFAEGLPSDDGYQSLSVIGSTGAAYADDHQNQQLIYADGGTRAVRTEEGLLSLVALVQQFVDDLRTERELWWTVDHWRETRLVARAVRHSLDSRQAIALEKYGHV